MLFPIFYRHKTPPLVPRVNEALETAVLYPLAVADLRQESKETGWRMLMRHAVPLPFSDDTKF